MARPDYDVIVVGTGPSGAFAAYHLARAGCSTLLLEKARLPRYKPCGGGVTTKALRLIDFDVSPVVERDIDRATVCFRTVPATHVDGHDMGRMVMRSRFDQHIVRMAVAAGAVLKDGCAVRGVAARDTTCVVSAADGDHSARFVIGADGTESVVARALGAPPIDACVAIEAEIDVEAETVARQRVLFDFGAIACGYGYMFPKAQHLSVGLYSVRPAVTSLKQQLDAYLQSGRVPRPRQVQSCVGHRVPLGRPRATLEIGRAVLVGDAAGLADPVWGEGIYYGLRSGQIAAMCVAEALHRGVPLRYASALQSELGRHLTWARVAAAAIYRLPEPVLAGLVREPRLANLMMDVLRGDAGYRQYAGGLVRRLPHLGAETWRTFVDSRTGA